MPEDVCKFTKFELCANSVFGSLLPVPFGNFQTYKRKSDIRSSLKDGVTCRYICIKKKKIEIFLTSLFNPDAIPLSAMGKCCLGLFCLFVFIRPKHDSMGFSCGIFLLLLNLKRSIILYTSYRVWAFCFWSKHTY